MCNNHVLVKWLFPGFPDQTDISHRNTSSFLVIFSTYRCSPTEFLLLIPRNGKTDRSVNSMHWSGFYMRITIIKATYTGFARKLRNSIYLGIYLARISLM